MYIFLATSPHLTGVNSNNVDKIRNLK